MAEKKNTLFENIKNSINSVDKSFQKQDELKNVLNNLDKNINDITKNKKIIKTISIDEKTQLMLNELKKLNYKINLSQLVRREVAKIYEELIKEIK
jgi:transcription initiation factor TFIIIB Brf1 subunit/transcription initiation factor TFIIB